MSIDPASRNAWCDCSARYRDDNTSHFLNCLEAQIDFPMRNLFGERASKDCYVGFTLVHRSGIFGTSDFLGNVDGGSDVLTGHLECKH